MHNIVTHDLRTKGQREERERKTVNLCICCHFGRPGHVGHIVDLGS